LPTAVSELQLIQEKVDIFYIHAPDRKVPIAETLSAIDELHKAGKFRRFGLSNFYVEEVEEVIRICNENNYVLPSVYQGNYSAVARRFEKTLFPLLRKHNIAFYAYSPIAGGFLTKTRQQIAEHAGRFDPNTVGGRMYLELYNKPSLLAALDRWNELSNSSGIPKAELAYRWVMYHSALKPEHKDAIVIGARNVEQLTQTINCFKNGPLKEDVVDGVEAVWKLVEEEAPLDNFNSTFWNAG
jgi:aflatoxin B1 aldehyde reductase